LISPDEEEYDELGALLKARIEEGNGETIFNIESVEGNNKTRIDMFLKG
jgi:hypothetical protein